MVTVGTLGHGGKGEAVGQMFAEGCGGEAQGWHGVRASCCAAWAEGTGLQGEASEMLLGPSRRS